MSKTKAVAETDLKNLLAKAGGTYVQTYEGLVAQVAKDAIERQPRSTVETRAAALAAAVENVDTKLLGKINGKLTSLMKKVKGNSEVTSNPEPKILDEQEALDLMTEFLDLKAVEEFTAVRRNAIKRTVFGSITESKAAEGVEHPEYVNGVIEVPALNMKFCREATGRVDPKLNEEKLRELVGEEVWSKVTTTELIPAYVETRFDIDAYMTLARTNPDLIPPLQDALDVPEGAAGWKPGRLMPREIKKGG